MIYTDKIKNVKTANWHITGNKKAENLKTDVHEKELCKQNLAVSYGRHNLIQSWFMHELMNIARLSFF